VGKLTRALIDGAATFLARLTRPSTQFMFSVALQTLLAILSIIVAEETPFAYELSTMQLVLLVWYAAIAQAEALQMLSHIATGDFLLYFSDFFNVVDVLTILLSGLSYAFHFVALSFPPEQRAIADGYTWTAPDTVVHTPDAGAHDTIDYTAEGAVLTWHAYKVIEEKLRADGDGEHAARFQGSGEWWLNRSGDLWGILAMLVLLRLVHALTLWDRLGPLIVMMRRMMVDLAVFIVLYGFVLIGFAILFMTIFAATGNDNFTSLTSSVVYLFYAALGAFDQNEDIEGRSFIVGNGLLMLWLTLSALLLLNLLIAMFADTYTAVRETAAAYYKFESASLKFEFCKKETLPPPFNVLQLLWGGLTGGLTLLHRLVMRCCGCCCAPKAGGAHEEAKSTRPTMSDAWKIVLKTVKKQLDAEKRAEDDDDEDAASKFARAIKPDFERTMQKLARLESELKALKKARATSPTNTPQKAANESDDDDDDDGED